MYCSWFARKWSAFQVKCIGYIGLVFDEVLMKVPRALVKYIVLILFLEVLSSRMQHIPFYNFLK